MKNPRSILLLVIALTAMGLAWWSARPPEVTILYRQQGLQIIEVHRARETGNPLREIAWDAASGWRLYETEWSGDRVRNAHWIDGGRLRAQHEVIGVGAVTTREEAPWIWEQSDLSEPDAPWILAGLPRPEWWRSLRADQIEPPRSGSHPFSPDSESPR